MHDDDGALDSYEVNMRAEQSNRRNLATARIITETTQQLTQDPFAYHEIATLEEDNDSADEQSVIETYFHEDIGFFVHESSLNTWIQLPEETADSLYALQQFNQENQFNLFEQQVDPTSITLVEGDDHYTITADGDLEGLEEAEEELFPALQGGFRLMMEDLDRLLNVESYTFEIIIDKDTMHMRAFTTTIDMMISSGQSAQISAQQSLQLTYSDYNDIESIDIPDDVVENAEQVQIDIEAFQELEGSSTDEVE
ncbi:DUF6612 family protein [Geomicrobium sp. JCM 19039]|uniref:DUF6612 family protein n=1 Tax=Geomicrobium sp. JCM 19039 TaxID=1460636 RepID=UPI0027D8A91A|nr:DUF6612 family protein [Geomicrobium sp. JCM 19039]